MMTTFDPTATISAPVSEMASAIVAATVFGFISLQLLCGCFLPLCLLAIACVSGYFVEQSHLRSLDERERALAGILRTDTRAIPAQLRADDEAGLLEARLGLSNVVLSIDHFRSFTTALRKLIGGELGLYGRLAMRARREALVRLLDEARAAGGIAVINVRFETSNINGVMQAQKNKGTMVEVLAYGTILRPRRAGVGATPRPGPPPPVRPRQAPPAPPVV